MNHQPRDATDTIMGDSDNQGIMPSNNSLPITTSASQPSIPAHMMTPNPDPISNIDAQIQYLQQQKFQQQQRQLQEQQAAFFSNHNHSVPPTPQSLEMPNSFYSQAEQVSQPGVYDPGYHQRMKEQDVRQVLFCASSLSRLVAIHGPPTNGDFRWPLLPSSHLPSLRLTLISAWIARLSPFLVLISALSHLLLFMLKMIPLRYMSTLTQITRPSKWNLILQPLPQLDPWICQRSRERRHPQNREARPIFGAHPL